jgi:hypothetical protein
LFRVLHEPGHARSEQGRVIPQIAIGRAGTIDSEGLMLTLDTRVRENWKGATWPKS